VLLCLIGQYNAAIVATSTEGVPSFSHSMSSKQLEMYIDSLNKRNSRLQAKINGLENIIAIYRRGILGMYPDGSTYGAAQYGGVIKVINF
jgi:uncharacterized protein YlxW (UPF0749 family)